MATSIYLPSEDHPQPECELASECEWFVKNGLYSSCCANRDYLICRKRLAEVFSPHERKQREADQ